MHADAAEVVLQARDDLARSPTRTRSSASTSSPSSACSNGRHVDEVLALVAVFGRLPALVARVERVPELAELLAGVVQVVLPVHRGALRGEEVGDRVADRDPATPARVQRPGRVGRHELEVDPRPCERRRRSRNRSPRRDHRPQHVGEPRRREEEVEEARARRSRPGRGGARPRPRARPSSARRSRGAAGRRSGDRARATGVAQSPWSRCLGTSSTMPASGSGRPAAASASRRA